MSTTLISAPQGAGKNLLVRQFLRETDMEIDFDALRLMSPAGLTNFLLKQKTRLFIVDEVFPCKFLKHLIELINHNGWTIVLLSNVASSEFMDYDINFVFSVELTHIKK